MRFKIIITLVGIVLVTGIFIGWEEIQRGLSARDNPTGLEKLIARTMRNMAIPGTASNLKNPVTATPERLTEARLHFADHCATCHANDGSGNTSIGRNLYPKAPDMRLADTQGLSDGQLYYIIHNGVRLTGMPAWGEATQEEDEDSWELVLFIRHLPKLTPEEVKDMEKANPMSTMEHDEAMQEEDFLKGGSSPSTNKGARKPHP
jgi:mono/diheme cytochrome c family protein